MSKKVRVLVSVVVAVVLLTVGSTVAVMAHGEESAPPPAPATKTLIGTANATALLARVAQILGIPQQDLVNAFKQAQQEMREEASTRALEKFTRALDKAVANGRLTQEQADQIKAWWQQRPEALGPGLFPRAFGVPGFGGGHMKGLPGGRMEGGHMRGWQKGWHSDNTTQND